VQLTQAALISLACLTICFAVLALIELGQASAQRTVRPGGGDRRIVTNFAMGIASMTLSAVLPISTVAAALWSESAAFGLFRMMPLPWPVLLAFLLLARSFASYGVHRISHAAPLLWRLHRVHHADRSVDLSTALRNHPLELLPTLVVAAGTVALLGPPVALVITVDTILFVATFWQHADIGLPPRIERLLRRVFVTPMLHRMHHSPRRAEHDRNYGDILVIWDRLFGTYAAPDMPILETGLEPDRHDPDRLLPQLASPFR
jgi:sterol desaturase/sphingolipid hydroxylase (fatty acid hydroxylase superfamily)